jgi:hypothetical protein
MADRRARCACGRVAIDVQGDPEIVVACHCEFCQRRSGNVFIAAAHYSASQVELRGETSCYNGLEADGVGAVGVDGGINYRFCTTCGSTLCWDFVHPATKEPRVAIAVGNFADRTFPAPTAEVFPEHRHHWVPPIQGAEQWSGA